MGLSRRQFTREFKLAAIQRLEMGASVAEGSRAFEVNPNTLHRWRQEFRQGPGNAFSGLGKRRGDDGRVAQLERKIGQQALEIDFLKGCLQRIDEQAEAAGTGWKAAVYKQIESQRKEDPGLTVERMCALAKVSWAGFYRHPANAPPGRSGHGAAGCAPAG